MEENASAPCCAKLISDVIAGAADAGIIAAWQHFRRAPGIIVMKTNGRHREFRMFRCWFKANDCMGRWRQHCHPVGREHTSSLG